jgi:molecular chaperone DnaJ
MIDDPYRVLGLTPDATDEEVKQAYRRLAKKYHPDMNPGDPHAAEMMNQINAAYDEIKNPQRATTTRQAYTDPFAGWYRQGAQAESRAGAGEPEAFQAARNWMKAQEYEEALRILETVPASQRTAEWYYLAAVANTNLGNRVLGYEQINRACAMEPDNELYNRTKYTMESSGRDYQSAQDLFHFGNADMSRICFGACLAFNAASCLCGRGGGFFCC